MNSTYHMLWNTLKGIPEHFGGSWNHSECSRLISKDMSYNTSFFFFLKHSHLVNIFGQMRMIREQCFSVRLVNFYNTLVQVFLMHQKSVQITGYSVVLYMSFCFQTITGKFGKLECERLYQPTMLQGEMFLRDMTLQTVVPLWFY